MPGWRSSNKEKNMIPMSERELRNAEITYRSVMAGMVLLECHILSVLLKMSGKNEKQC
jgi:hypothetical protein